MDLVSAELPARTLVVAIDPGKVSNRVVLANGEQGLIGEPVSLSVQRDGDQHERRDGPVFEWPETVFEGNAAHAPGEVSGSAPRAADYARAPLTNLGAWP